MPYTLQSDDNKSLDKGYLLSPRDLCSLENLPDLISAGVSSFKIEGRMKSPTYVATVTRIYRKYIDLATKYINKEIPNYEIEEKDIQDLMQVFNRGRFSKGHLLDDPNKKLIFSQKPNNMGIYLGKILKFNSNKGLVTAKLENTVSIGDGISFENEDTKYTISELMQKNANIKTASNTQIVTFGRMKGNIKVGDKIYKLTDKNLSNSALASFGKEYKKTYLSCKLDIHSGQKIAVNIKSIDFNLEEKFEYDFIPAQAQNAPITKTKVKEQFIKTLNTCFEFSNIEIDLDDNLFIPTSILNEIRRQAISLIEAKIVNSFKRISNIEFKNDFHNSDTTNIQKKAILLNTLDISFDYSKLKKVDRIYIPLKYFSDTRFDTILKTLSVKSKLYIYMPVVIKDRYLDTIKSIVLSAVEKFDISGIVVSEISALGFVKDLNLDLIANYNFNVYNSYTANELKNLGFSTVTLSPELDETELSNTSVSCNKEAIIYGKIPLMTMSYCLLGKSNRCYKDCKKFCLSDNEFYLNDRYNFKFRVIPDNLQTLTTIYNSRNISHSNINSDFIRFDILDETVDDINKIIN